MDCEKIRRWIDLGVEERRVADHAGSCEACRAYLREHEALVSAMSSWEDVEEPADLQALMERGGLTRRTLASRLPWQRPWFSRLAVAGGAAAVGLVLLALANTTITVGGGVVSLQVALHRPAPAADMLVPAVWSQGVVTERDVNEVAADLWMQREADLAAIKREMYGMATWMEQELDRRDARLLELIRQVSGEPAEPQP